MEENLSSEIDIRRQKIEELKKSGEIPYKEKYERTCTISESREKLGEHVKIAGRIIFRRIMGKFGFCQIRDVYDKIQISVGRNEFSEEDYNFYKKMIDIGDFIGVEGEVYATQTGEITVKAEKITLLSKTLRPLPEKFHGVVDTEIKYRQRYLDLITNEDARKIFLTRSKVVSFIRRFLEDNGFIEVETPILQTSVSGASAKPFFTHHNALDIECNLRIATECYLKQCIGAGIDRVFELGKDFRNEGMDPSHLQEFTQVEWYASYWNYENNIEFFHDMLIKLMKECVGTTKINYQGQEIEFDGDWTRIDYVAKMRELLGCDFLDIDNVDELKKIIVDRKLFGYQELEECKSVRTLIDYVYKRKIRAGIVNPTILYNYPASLIPLARRNDKDDRIIDVFQVVAGGAELVKAYSELVDPIVQRKTLELQLEEKKAGDEETMDVDEDFLLAMEHGMPPISGLGFGIDRFLQFIFDRPNIRDVVLFPLMK
ncbi:MAG TPA: lysine--tRNA ligase [Candidatus Caccovivens faecavium]|nr:lysine--tRNA ligase [Candidatus Caccovivens faecavium]